MSYRTTDVQTHRASLGSLSTAELCELACIRRDNLFGSRVSYSPKVFIPLTRLCRDQCKYCTFAQPPANVSSPFLMPEDVLQIANEGAQAGCHEALFTLGERPELRYPAAVQWLQDRGYSSTVDYLAAMCELVRQETGLLPHANPGAMTIAELGRLREVSVSQGMMLESVRPDLDCHSQAPDKDPQRRLETLRAAGELAIPYTTGILVGIGETESDRVEAINAIAVLAKRYGHIQEVIVQNFRPKVGTGMWKAPAADEDQFRRAIALARLLLPPGVHVQAPPNLSDDAEMLVASGIDDLGGLSPVTVDHVNPERPWPKIDQLKSTLASLGRQLVPRLTIYPEFASQPETWLDPKLRFDVLDHSDGENLARDDLGPFVLHRHESVKKPAEGAEVRLRTRSKATWYSGIDGAPNQLVGVPSTAATKPIAEVLQAVADEATLGVDELLLLFSARGDDVAHVAKAADLLRKAVSGDDVTYVVNQNINYTNVCTFKCKFCGFSKGPLSLNLRGTPYLLSLTEIQQRVARAWDNGATEVCLQGGIHPDFDGDYYIDVCRAVNEVAPNIHIHGFTALEVTEGARRSAVSLTDYLTELKAVGLKSLPGTAAEILDDDVRAILCPDKISSEQWLEAHRVAHQVGLRSNVTMMFGAVEEPKSWVEHLLVTRSLQKETGGFTEFVGLPFVHMAAPIYLQKNARRGPTFRETVLVHAIARIAYHGLIDNIQASWVKVGFVGAAQLLGAGCNDLGGTLTNENISRAAGADHGQSASLQDLDRLTQNLNRGLKQRTTLYEDA